MEMLHGRGAGHLARLDDKKVQLVQKGIPYHTKENVEETVGNWMRAKRSQNGDLGLMIGKVVHFTTSVVVSHQQECLSFSEKQPIQEPGGIEGISIAGNDLQITGVRGVVLWSSARFSMCNLSARNITVARGFYAVKLGSPARQGAWDV